MAQSSTEEYELLIIKYGTRRTIRREVFLNYHLYDVTDGDTPIDMDYFIWVARNAERTVLIDTGYSERTAQRRGRSFTVTVPTALQRLGVTDAPELTVVLTHGHYDHVGNAGLFPTARILMAQAEYEFWTGGYPRRQQFHYSIEDEELDELKALKAAGRLTLTRGDQEVAPGISILEIGGHTPGELMVTVQTTDGPVLLTSDAMHYYEEYDNDYPFAITADVPGAYDAFDRIRRMFDQQQIAHLVSGHDPSTFERFPPDAGGPLPGMVATIGARARARARATGDE
jgi:glyoxylase-like metal-dependent hydrolase (beta-lactamase superfamily II)